MIADTMDDHGADAFREIGEAVLDRQHDAVIERIALGRTVKAHGQHGARLLDLQQFGLTRSRGGGGVSHGCYCFLFRIVISYNYWRTSQQPTSSRPLPLPLEGEGRRE